MSGHKSPLTHDPNILLARLGAVRDTHLGEAQVLHPSWCDLHSPYLAGIAKLAREDQKTSSHSAHQHLGLTLAAVRSTSKVNLRTNRQIMAKRKDGLPASHLILQE